MRRGACRRIRVDRMSVQVRGTKYEVRSTRSCRSLLMGVRVFRRFAVVLSFIPGVLAAQSQREFASRREALLRKVSDGVIVAFGAHEPPQDYLSFFQAPSFYYLTGLREPDAALVMVKKNGQVNATMFVQPRLPAREVWTGSRMGTGAVEALTGVRGRSSDDLATVLDSLA